MISQLFRTTRAIGQVTFQEIVRDKVLYNVLFFAVIVLGIGLLGAQMTYVHPERIALDFGISAMGVSCSLLACLTGASLLNREFERRTALVALSHPISRSQFVLGKFAGLVALLVLNWLLVALVFLGILAIAGGDQFRAALSATLGWAVVMTLFQSIVLASVTLFFSTFCTTSLTIMFTIGIYLIGNNLSELRMLAAKSSSPGISTLLTGLSVVLPNLEHFNLGRAVTYALPVPFELVITGIAYGLVLSAVFLLLSAVTIQVKDLS